MLRGRRGWRRRLPGRGLRTTAGPRAQFHVAANDTGPVADDLSRPGDLPSLLKALLIKVADAP